MNGITSLLIAVVLAILSAVMINKHIQSKVEAINAAWQPATIIAFKHDLPSGHAITPEDVTEMEVPIAIAKLPLFYSWDQQFSKVQNGSLVLSQDVKQGEPLLASAFGQANRDDSRRSFRLGHDIVSVRVNQITGAAGYIRDGDSVDVFLTYGQSEPVTELIMSGVKVFSAGSKLEAESSSRPGQTRAYSVVGLEVNAQQAAQLIQAQQVGQLNLALRHRGDANEHKVTPVRTKDLSPGRN